MSNAAAAPPRAHCWADARIRAPDSHSPFFADEFGRAVHLRGVNLCGHSKLPTYPVSASTHLTPGPEFFSHRNVSFVGRPFPVKEADEHFNRLRTWGLTFVRLLVPWEALEHSGPGLYDEDFIDYLIVILKKAEKHGIKCFIDPHQDTWSRFSGGSGAPGWTFEVAGMDITSFQAVGAAHVHNFNETEQNPHMFWPTNYAKLASATMFTLFFGGEIFAPECKYQGVNVGKFLQDSYIACYAHFASRIKHCRSVIGFEFMNEPHYGYIGLKNMNKFDSMAFFHFGAFPSAVQSFALGSGLALDVDVYVKSWPHPTRKSGTKMLNTERRSAWINYGNCIWKRHGLWDISPTTGKPQVLKPNYFRQHPVTLEPVEFYRDCYMPVLRRYKAAIEAVNRDLLLFFEPIPNEDPPIFTDADREEPNYVFAPHWYDLKALVTKNFDGIVTFDVQGLARGTKSVLSAMYFGLSGAERNYSGQLRNIFKTGRNKVGPRPVLMGECGIPMDINEKKAYETGDYELHSYFLDAVISSMEENLLNFTLWNYNPGNDNTYGDHWNGEDFSIYSPSASAPGSRSSTPIQSRCASPLPERATGVKQPIGPSKLSISTVAPQPMPEPNIIRSSSSRSSLLSSEKHRSSNSQPRLSSPDRIPSSPFEITELTYMSGLAGSALESDRFSDGNHDGGRALDAVIRPYAAKVAGIPTVSKFRLKKLEYRLEFTTNYDSQSASAHREFFTTPASAWDKRYVSEIFVPNFHYQLTLPSSLDNSEGNFEDDPEEIRAQLIVKVSDGEWVYDQKRQTLQWHYDPTFKNLGDISNGGVVKHSLVLVSAKKGFAQPERRGFFDILFDFVSEMCGLGGN
ncbi:hypothetical protein HDU83_005045 [Entophlyctis luteolus]|nr:hypothetical protein HDU83_005045 [Entophlyctis luteolus]